MTRPTHSSAWELGAPEKPGLYWVMWELYGVAIGPDIARAFAKEGNLIGLSTLEIRRPFVTHHMSVHEPMPPKGLKA